MRNWGVNSEDYRYRKQVESIEDSAKEPVYTGILQPMMRTERRISVLRADKGEKEARPTDSI